MGLSQQLDKIVIREVPLLSTSVTVVDTARDLDVVLTVNCRWTHMSLLSVGGSYGQYHDHCQWITDK